MAVGCDSSARMRSGGASAIAVALVMAPMLIMAAAATADRGLLGSSGACVRFALRAGTAWLAEHHAADTNADERPGAWALGAQRASAIRGAAGVSRDRAVVMATRLDRRSHSHDSSPPAA